MRDLGFQEMYGAVPEQDLQSIEREIGCALPDDYRRYLSTHGGGWAPRDRFFPVHWPANYPGSAQAPWQWVLNFLRCTPDASAEGSISGTWRNLRIKESGDYGLPAELLPIVLAGGTAYLLLALSGQHSGKVFIVDVNDRPEEPDWDYYVPVAASFSLWLESLVEAGAVPAEYRDV